MHDPVSLGAVEGLGQREGDGQRLLDAQLGPLGLDLAQGLTVHELHRYELDAGPGADSSVYDHHDVRVLELRRRAGFALEASHVGLVLLGQGAEQDLERDHPVEALLAGLVDPPHVPGPELFMDLEARHLDPA